MTTKASSGSYDPDESGKKPRKKRKPRKISERYLRNAGLYYLERFASSASNFKDVMMRKARKSIKFHGEPTIQEAEVMIDALVEQFIELEYLNDAAYARTKAISYRRKGHARRKVVMKLLQKGVAPDIAEDAIAETDEREYQIKDKERAEIAAAERYAKRRRLGQWSYKEKREDYDQYEKDLAKLARAGFSYDIAKQVLKKNE